MQIVFIDVIYGNRFWPSTNLRCRICYQRLLHECAFYVSGITLFVTPVDLCFFRNLRLENSLISLIVQSRDKILVPKSDSLIYTLLPTGFKCTPLPFLDMWKSSSDMNHLILRYIEFLLENFSRKWIYFSIIILEKF